MDGGMHGTTDRPSRSISVVLPTYNGARYLQQQLESILAQSQTSDEIVLADDGSTDATAAIADSFASSSGASVRVIRGEHLGLRGNVQRALQAARGDVVVLADQDDLWAPGKLDAVSAAFSDPAVTLWFSDASFIDSEGTSMSGSAWQSVALDEATLAAIEAGHGLPRLIHGQTVTGATMAIRRDVLDVALPLPLQLESPGHAMLHDGWLCVLAAVLGRTIADPYAFTLYRQHAEQATGMSMTTAPATSTSSRVVRDDRRSQLALDRLRVRLVLDRLTERDALSLCRQHDAEWLLSADTFYSVRVTPHGYARVRGIARELRAGRYERFARGWRTALSDVITSPRI